MSGLRGRVYATRTITTKMLIGISFSLIVVVLICTLLNFPRALAATILSDDFNDNSIDTAKWNPNDLFSGFTNTNVPIAETSQRLEIGPLLQNVSGSSYRGMRTVNTYTFSDAYAYVELVQAPASNTAADAMLTIGQDANSYYRIYVEAGVLICQKRINGTKTDPKKQYVVHKGDTISLGTPGGGGHGDPRQRDAAAVAADIECGYVLNAGPYERALR